MVRVIAAGVFWLAALCAQAAACSIDPDIFKCPSGMTVDTVKCKCVAEGKSNGEAMQCALVCPKDEVLDVNKCTCKSLSGIPKEPKDFIGIPKPGKD